MQDTAVKNAGKLSWDMSNQAEDTISTNQDVWALDGDEYLLVTYGTGGKVKEAEFVIP